MDSPTRIRSAAEALKLVSRPQGCPPQIRLGYVLFVPSEVLALAAAIKENGKHICELHLTGCRIDDEGAGALAGVLHRHDNLRTLVLSHNSIGDKGARALLHATAQSDLEILDLSGNRGMSDDTAASLSALVRRSCPRLQGVFLGPPNQISRAGTLQLLQAYAETPRRHFSGNVVLVGHWLSGGARAYGLEARYWGANNDEILEGFYLGHLEKLLAFGMGLHPRLGATSPVVLLARISEGWDNALFRAIGSAFWA